MLDYGISIYIYIEQEGQFYTQCANFWYRKRKTKQKKRNVAIASTKIIQIMLERRRRTNFKRKTAIRSENS